MRTADLSTDAVYACRPRPSQPNNTFPVNVLDTSTFYRRSARIYAQHGYTPTAANRYKSTQDSTTGLLCQDEHGHTLLAAPAHLLTTWDSYVRNEADRRAAHQMYLAAREVKAAGLSKQSDALRSLLLSHPDLPAFYISDAAYQRVPSTTLLRLLTGYRPNV